VRAALKQFRSATGRIGKLTPGDAVIPHAGSCKNVGEARRAAHLGAVFLNARRIDLTCEVAVAAQRTNERQRPRACDAHNAGSAVAFERVCRNA
jgi:hypothetical protein